MKKDKEYYKLNSVHFLFLTSFIYKLPDQNQMCQNRFIQVCFWVFLRRRYFVLIEYSQNIDLPIAINCMVILWFASTVTLNKFGGYIKAIEETVLPYWYNNEDMNINSAENIIIHFYQKVNTVKSILTNIAVSLGTATINKVIKICPHFKYQIIVMLLRCNFLRS